MERTALARRATATDSFRRNRTGHSFLIRNMRMLINQTEDMRTGLRPHPALSVESLQRDPPTMPGRGHFGVWVVRSRLAASSHVIEGAFRASRVIPATASVLPSGENV